MCFSCTGKEGRGEKKSSTEVVFGFSVQGLNPSLLLFRLIVRVKTAQEGDTSKCL